MEPGGLVAAEKDCSSCLPGPGPIAALVVADVIVTLLIAGGAYRLAGRGRGAQPQKPRPPEPESTYQELQGARDLYSDLKRPGSAVR
ncbi:TYRO protein tyrosine kinase-binding protein [Eudromia elegans]